MKIAAILLLFAAAPAFAQTGGGREADLQQLSQMAALMPASDEFDETWKAYVRNHVSDMAEADAAIEKIREGAREFSRGIRVPRSGSGAAMPGYKLRDKLIALAAEVLDTEVEGAEEPE
jgi:hypothetical protein